jgi:hypothetical protein
MKANYVLTTMALLASLTLTQVAQAGNGQWDPCSHDFTAKRNTAWAGAGVAATLVVVKLLGGSISAKTVAFGAGAGVASSWALSEDGYYAVNGSDRRIRRQACLERRAAPPAPHASLREDRVGISSPAVVPASASFALPGR